MTQPRIIIIAGPNGAGKTTFAREILYDSSGQSPVMLERSDMERRDIVREQEQPYAGLPADASPLLKATHAAMLRAAERARELARQTGTNLVLYKDGRKVIVKPEPKEP